MTGGGSGRTDEVRRRPGGWSPDGTIVEERHDEFSWWIVTTDIEGNEFCLQ